MTEQENKREFSLGDRIGEMRGEMDLTIEAFAQLADVHPRTVIRWEQNDAEPRRKKLQRLNDAYDAWKSGASMENPVSARRYPTGEDAMARGSRRHIRFGICCEFWDTTFPVLCDRGVTGTFAKHGLPSIQFMPVPWDNRALASLSDLLDIVIYNEHCAYEFKRSEPMHARFVIYKDKAYRSGHFYIVLRSAHTQESSIKAALRSIFEESTLLIVPSADFEITIKFLAKAWFGDRWADVEPSFDRRLLRVPTGTGARMVAEWNADHGVDRIAYVGGQDQRTYLEQELGGDSQFRVLEFEDMKKVVPSFDVPDSLFTNRLIASNADVHALLPAVALAIDEAIGMATKDDHALTDVHQAIARWHHLYNTRFFGLPYDAVEDAVSKLVQTRFGNVTEYSETAGEFRPKLFAG